MTLIALLFIKILDVVAVTNGSPINYTTCPRTIEEVESVRSGGSWPPAEDKAPELFRKWGKLDKTTHMMVETTLA